ncbi:hypothetical protein BTO32_15200 [Marinobacter lutaoensis]|uniref:Replication protein n=1 Tax=Marinobacter lutaoensis TaxID=135739 RepID=A0A1V2DPK0_9GAMM|nr:hypothetical protein BTO32_15200 [Marinobacter lutaoensis]
MVKDVAVHSALEHLHEDLSVLSEQDLQYSLDLLTDRDRSHNGISGVLVYDLAPKWVNYRRVKEVTAEAQFTRKFRVLGHPFSVTVKAARIKRPSGEDVLMFPGDREQVVEDTLRWMSTHGHGQLFASRLGSRFSIYSLRKLLKEANHSMSHADISEALDVLHGSHLIITDEVTGQQWSELFLPQYGRNGEETASDGRTYYREWFVTFHTLVNQAMLAADTRLVSWHTLMALTNNLAKYVYRRMSLVYSQASSIDPYTISLSEIMSGYGKPLVEGKPISNHMRDMKRALEVLGRDDVIDLERLEIRKKKEGNRDVDAIFTFFPGAKFIDQAITANQASKELELALERRAGQQKIKRIIKDIG